MMRTIGRLVMSFTGIVVVAAMTAGCQPQQQEGAATRPTTMAAVVGEIPADVLMVRPARQEATGAAQEQPRSASDPQAGVSQARVVTMEAYVINVPAGTISRSEAFWKRIDESGALRPGEYDLMRRNGVRVGLGRVEEWGFFKEIIDERPAATQRYSLMSVGGKSVEIEMARDVAVQNVFHHDKAGQLEGRTYENCQNLWSVAFAPVPRFPDHVRVGMSPLVRSQRKRLEVVERRARPEDPSAREIVYRAPEYLFDLAMEADVPPGRFLVVAPSEEATGGTVGEVFLMGEGLGQRVERVVLMVPRVVEATLRPVEARGK